MPQNLALASFLGKEVQIYPRDSYAKRGVVEGVSDAGVIFRVTHSEASDFPVGKRVFIAFSNHLTFHEV